MNTAQRITRLIDFFYVAPLRRILPRQTFRYGACGGANLLLDYALYFVIYNYVLHEQILHLGIVAVSAHIAAFLLEFPVTFFAGFWLNRNVVFPGSLLPHGVQMLRYLMVVCGSIILNYLCLKLFVEGCMLPAEIAKILTMIITVVYSYIMQKRFTFKGNR